MLLGFASENIEQTFASLANTGIGLGFLLVLMIGWPALAIVMLVFTVTRGTEGPNRHGDDPYGRGNLEEVFA